jgi:hypothetical protein
MDPSSFLRHQEIIGGILFFGQIKAESLKQKADVVFAGP